MTEESPISKPLMADILRDAIEVAHQAEYDLSGEQREFHLPRIKRIWIGLASWFPGDFVKAMREAKDGYGYPIAK